MSCKSHQGSLRWSAKHGPGGKLPHNPNMPSEQCVSADRIVLAPPLQISKPLSHSVIIVSRCLTSSYDIQPCEQQPLALTHLIQHVHCGLHMPAAPQTLFAQG